MDASVTLAVCLPLHGVVRACRMVRRLTPAPRATAVGAPAAAPLTPTAQGAAAVLVALSNQIAASSGAAAAAAVVQLVSALARGALRATLCVCVHLASTERATARVKQEASGTLSTAMLFVLRRRVLWRRCCLAWCWPPGSCCSAPWTTARTTPASCPPGCSCCAARCAPPPSPPSRRPPCLHPPAAKATPCAPTGTRQPAATVQARRCCCWRCCATCLAAARAQRRSSRCRTARRRRWACCWPPSRSLPGQRRRDQGRRGLRPALLCNRRCWARAGRWSGRCCRC